MSFEEAVRTNVSIAGVIKSLGRAIVGTNYRFVKREVTRLGIDTSHWKGQSHGTSGQILRVSAKQVMTINSRHNTGIAKKVVLREGLIPYECAECLCQPVWREKPLVLRLDHKNGVRNDHRLQNLRFLCPNCDSQTDTFCGRNKLR